MEIQKAIFNYLHDRGCCKICAVRYLCNRSLDLRDVDSYLIKHNFLVPDAESETKRCKANPCLVCLGLLQERCLLEITESTELLKVNEYDSAKFTCSISMPAAILIREHSMKLHLLDKFPEFYSDDNIEIPLNKAWKMCVKDQLAKQTGKTFENSDVCNFFIHTTMSYKCDIESGNAGKERSMRNIHRKIPHQRTGQQRYQSKELSVLKELQPKLFQKRSVQNKKYKGELYTRKGVLNALSLTGSGQFKSHAAVPPEIPAEFLHCETIVCKHNAIFIGGRYCKFSRNLSQSPWIVGNVRTMETSVQEIIFDGISKILSIPAKNLKFTASGREDCDVRCLGKGRPFYIEVFDPKRTAFDFEEFRKLEAAINVSPLIQVALMQLVPKSELTRIKEGEDSKTKDYNALCITKVKVTQEFIDKLNSFAPADIEQRTPIRVLHRRPLATRTRRIHEMKASFVPDKPFLVDLFLKTQAGTYVKEFVHGDFGRTTPSVGEIIRSEVDIIALDVTSIDLDWPSEVTDDKSD